MNLKNKLIEIDKRINKLRKFMFDDKGYEKPFYKNKRERKKYYKELNELRDAKSKIPFLDSNGEPKYQKGFTTSSNSRYQYDNHDPLWVFKFVILWAFIILIVGLIVNTCEFLGLDLGGSGPRYEGWE
tara:strand:- start:809 stop:1192 length:384 start_codon:yes stop_codon:yes gene_type:complete